MDNHVTLRYFLHYLFALLSVIGGFRELYSQLNIYDPNGYADYLICVETSDGIKEMSFEKYVTGVLLAEVSPQFEMDAIKAQTVASRTYAIKADRSIWKHAEEPLCTDAACCQSYISEKVYWHKTHSLQNLTRVKKVYRKQKN